MYSTLLIGLFRARNDSGRLPRYGFGLSFEGWWLRVQGLWENRVFAHSQLAVKPRFATALVI